MHSEGNMLDNIGTTAGEIWHYLEEHDEASIGKLTKELNKTERMIVAGIGFNVSLINQTINSTFR